MKITERVKEWTLDEEVLFYIKTCRFLKKRMRCSKICIQNDF